MVEYKGIYLPDGETHLIEWMEIMKQFRDGKPMYQGHKYDAAMKHVRRRGLAVDVGGHCGLWSRVMALDFARVVAFEPMKAHIECWKANMAGHGNAQLVECALGETEGEVFIKTRTPGSSGDTGVDPAAERSSLRAAVDSEGQATPLKRLDDFHLMDVDFMKLDTEGYELFVLRGAEETLKRCKPTIIVEQKAETGGAERYGIGVTDAVKYLQGLGAVLRGSLQGDYILSWNQEGISASATN